MIIRKMCVEDAKKVLDYLKIVGGETDNLTFGDEGIGLSLEEEKTFIEKNYNSDNSLNIIIENNEEIIGTLTLSISPKKRLNHSAEIGISVKKDYRNKGIGSSLLSEAIKFANNRGLDNIRLNVRSDNTRAISLYKKFGFKKVGTIYRYLKINDKFYDCDLMELVL